MADQEIEELKQLESNIAKLEAAIVANPERKTILSSAIDGMRQRASELDKKLKEREEREQTVKANEAAIREAVAKETALNAGEKETYSGFLNKDFFTKSDFGALDKFYSHSWDKLTEDGKDEMSHRVWEGVRHGEYTFNELPKAVKEKETERVYQAILKDDRSRIDLAHLPSKDREDFISAHESGDKSKTYEVLSRDSFKNSVSVEKPKSIQHSEVEVNKEADSKILAKPRGDITSNAERSSALDNKDLPSFSGFNLDCVKLAEAKDVTKPDLPRSPQASGRAYS